MEELYRQKVRDTIIKILETNTYTLCEIIERAMGAYPYDVKAMIEELVKNNLIFSTGNMYSLKPVSNLSNVKINRSTHTDKLSWLKSELDKLSVPHPADYDWRFTISTVEALTLEVLKYKKPNCNLALLGVTTMFPFIKKYHNDVHVSLFNKSHSIIEDLKKLGYNEGLNVQDLFTPINGSKKFDLVVADPPWYSDFYQAFILRAAEVIKNGGYLFLSVLPPLTRPNAEDEIIEIMEYAKNCGFSYEKRLSNFLSYESPLFEKSSLALQGIECSNWRKGDLFVFRKESNIQCNQNIFTPADEPQWDEYNIMQKKFKLQKLNDQEKKFSFNYVDKTKLLSTVSRRFANRNKINFWSSDNYAFQVRRLAVLRHFLNEVSSGSSIKIASSKTEEFFVLTSEEKRELNSLLSQVEVI